MKFIVAKIAKEILAEQKQVKMLEEAYEIELQKRLDLACKNDDSHTRSLSQ